MIRTSASRDGDTIVIIAQIQSGDILGDATETIHPGDSAFGHGFDWWAYQIEVYEEHIPRTASIDLARPGAEIGDE